MKNIREIKLFAVINKKNPRLKFINLYPDKDVKINKKDEVLIEVIVKKK